MKREAKRERKSESGLYQKPEGQPSLVSSNASSSPLSLSLIFSHTLSAFFLFFFSLVIHPSPPLPALASLLQLLLLVRRTVRRFRAPRIVRATSADLLFLLRQSCHLSLRQSLSVRFLSVCVRERERVCLCSAYLFAASQSATQ